MLDYRSRLTQILDPRPIDSVDAIPTSTPGALSNRMLEALAEAYARGDAPRGERLLVEALDQDLPWDQVCAAAASGVSRRYTTRSGGPARA